MIQRNQVDLIGHVGSVRTSEYNGRKVANFNVAVNTAYNRGEEQVIETNWVPVVAWAGKFITPLEKIGKGTPVHVRGRLQNVRYTNAAGQEVTTFQVLASSLSVVVKEEQPEAEEPILGDMPEA